MSDFREHLHAWALEQLKKSDHNGTIEIESVRIYAPEIASSIGGDEMTVWIFFRHTGCSYVQWNGERCDGWQSWWLPEIQDAVSMLNGILALADREGVAP